VRELFSSINQKKAHSLPCPKDSCSRKIIQEFGQRTLEVPRLVENRVENGSSVMLVCVFLLKKAHLRFAAAYLPCVLQEALQKTVSELRPA